MRSILALVFTTVLVAASSVQAQEARPLSGAEIAKLVAGNTIKGTMEKGGPYKEFYLPDGTILGADYKGKWTVVNDMLCFNYDPAKADECWSARLTTANEVQWIKDGKVDGTGQVSPGNTENF